MAPTEGHKRTKTESRLISADEILKKMADLNFAVTVIPSSLERDHISCLRPGLGLVGGSAEEEAYYKAYVDKSKPVVQHEIDSGDTVEGITTVEVYRDPSKKDAEQDVNLGEIEGTLSFGYDWFVHDDQHIHATNYLGKSWVRRIHALYDVPTMMEPLNMAVKPHDYQLKAAAQAHLSCTSNIRGFILGDGMGVGKTLTAILAMYAVKHEPGFSLVIAPNSVCEQWVQEIRKAWDDGHGMTVSRLKGTHVTAHDILATACDVLICSYEQVEAWGRKKEDLPDRLDAYSNDQEGGLPLPTRPYAPLNSGFWRKINLPIKRLVLDEAHTIKLRSGLRHEAISRLYYHSVIMMSGTLPHNKWHNVSGYVDLLQDTPFNTHRKFMEAFSDAPAVGTINKPSMPQMRLLQRFMQGFTIARPTSILNLKDLQFFRLSFTIDRASEAKVSNFVKEFRNGESQPLNINTDALGEDSTPFKWLMMAQMSSIHPLLAVDESAADDFVVQDPENPTFGYVEKSFVDDGSRTEWLQKIAKQQDLLQGANRLCRFMSAYRQLRRTMPNRKIVVFSQFIRFLDIVAEELRRSCDIVSLRFDGTVTAEKRMDVQKTFKECDPSIPLLITSGAGGVGLNITAASIVIQTEVWWNANVQLQAYARVHRQGQVEESVVLQLFATNSDIDTFILSVQQKKTAVNSELMRPIIRRPEEGPDILPLLTKQPMQPMEFAKPDTNAAD